MASRLKTCYVCSECGYESPKWLGQCPQCKEWNTLNEEIIQEVKKGGNSNVRATSLKAEKIDSIEITDEFRYKTGIGELDNVLGGGIVKGSVILLSGDPGIGKSTLLMQMCGILANDINVLYVSGEESSKQLKLRADRLGVSSPNITVVTETDAQMITEYIYSQKPDIVMIDSIQTMSHPEIGSSQGSITQIRECTNLFLRAGKSLNIPMIIVGHVNKDGNIAGPKVLEHIVDTVLYFEGERNNSYRILRAVKNRFGSTNEIGVFEMVDKGLREVQNPSASILSGRSVNVEGSAVTCVLEGSRPILAEVQALVTTSGFGNPRRMSTGFDYNRLNLILAVMEKRLGYIFSNLDAYLNVVGGLRIDEPATDLSVAMALISSLKETPIPEDIVFFGEIGLLGEVRGASRADSRIKEIAKMGFKRCVVPRGSLSSANSQNMGDIQIIEVTNIREAVNILF